MTDAEQERLWQVNDRKREQLALDAHMAQLEAEWPPERCAAWLITSRADARQHEESRRRMFVNAQLKKACGGKSLSRAKQAALLPKGEVAKLPEPNVSSKCDGCARWFLSVHLMREIVSPVRRWQLLCARCADAFDAGRLRRPPVEEWLEDRPPEIWNRRHGHGYRPIEARDLEAAGRLDIPKGKTDRKSIFYLRGAGALVDGLSKIAGARERDMGGGSRGAYDRELGHLWEHGGRRAVWTFEETPRRADWVRLQRHCRENREALRRARLAGAVMDGGESGLSMLNLKRQTMRLEALQGLPELPPTAPLPDPRASACEAAGPVPRVENALDRLPLPADRSTPDYPPYRG